MVMDCRRFGLLVWSRRRALVVRRLAHGVRPIAIVRVPRWRLIEFGPFRSRGDVRLRLCFWVVCAGCRRSCIVKDLERTLSHVWSVEDVAGHAVRSGSFVASLVKLSNFIREERGASAFDTHRSGERLERPLLPYG